MATSGKQKRFGACSETKSEFCDRLRSEGRWTAFADERDELRRNGVAVDEAWERLAPKYQPVTAPATPEPAPAATPPAADAPEYLQSIFTSDNCDPLTADVARDAAWVYHNFGQEITPPPSPGALQLLLWARSNRTAFFKDVLPRLKSSTPDEEKKLRDDGRKLFDIIERFRHANKILCEREGCRGKMKATPTNWTCEECGHVVPWGPWPADSSRPWSTQVEAASSKS